MKKKILSGFTVLAIAVGAAFNMSINSSDGLADIASANIEALAEAEVGAPYPCNRAACSKDCEFCGICYNTGAKHCL